MALRAGLVLLSVTSFCAPALAQQPTLAQTPGVPSVQNASPLPTTDGRANEAEAARQRTETREREWDRKMRASTNSICKGC